MKNRIIAVIFVLFLAFSTFTITAQAAVTSTVYSTSLAFQGYHQGPVRSYTGSSSSHNMHWKGTTYTENQLPGMSTTFTITLWKYSSWGTHTLIGSKTVNRSGYLNLTWSNPALEDGQYFFEYLKDNTDGVNVKSDSVILGMY